jgi:sulfur carrier protein
LECRSNTAPDGDGIVSESPRRLKCEKAGLARAFAGLAGHRWAAGAQARDNAGMDIRLNGDALALPAPCTIAELLAAQGLAERRVAVEVNGEIVPRGRHVDHALADGDVVEIVHALGGG